METAHEEGLESTATFMMGTGETNAERIEHLRMIRDVQDRTGGFRSFIPWTYQPENNHLKGRTQATSLEYLRMVAVARLFFDNINHLQGSWLTTGKDIGQLTLHFGADDLGSVMLEENVVSQRRRAAPQQPHRADRADPRRRAHPGAARHALPPPRRAPRPGRRPGRRPRALALQLDGASRCCPSQLPSGRRSPAGTLRMSLAVAVPLGVASSLVYGSTIVVQHRASHNEGEEDARHLLRLLRDPLWVAAVLGDFLGFLLNAAALAAGPVVVIQPLVVLMLPVALIVGWLLGGPRPTAIDYLSSLAIVAGLSGFLVLIGTPGAGHAPKARYFALTVLIVLAVGSAGRAVGARPPRGRARRGLRRRRRHVLRHARRVRRRPLGRGRATAAAPGW